MLVSIAAPRKRFQSLLILFPANGVRLPQRILKWDWKTEGSAQNGLVDVETLNKLEMKSKEEKQAFGGLAPVLLIGSSGLIYVNISL